MSILENRPTALFMVLFYFSDTISVYYEMITPPPYPLSMKWRGGEKGERSERVDFRKSTYSSQLGQRLHPCPNIIIKSPPPPRQKKYPLDLKAR